MIQTRKAVVVKEGEVRPGLDQPDHGPHLTVEHRSVQGAVAALRVLAVHLALPAGGEPLQDADQPPARRHVHHAAPGHVLAPARVMAAASAPDQHAQLRGARAQRAGQLAGVLGWPASGGAVRARDDWGCAGRHACRPTQVHSRHF